MRSHHERETETRGEYMQDAVTGLGGLAAYDSCRPIARLLRSSWILISREFVINSRAHGRADARTLQLELTSSKNMAGVSSNGLKLAHQQQ